MKSITESVFTVKEIRDIGIEPVIARFKFQEEARKLAELVGGYGGKIDKELLEFKIYDTFEEYMQDKKPQMVKSALSKLSKEEKFALGLE